MKKLIICLFIAIALSNCEVKVQSTQAQEQAPAQNAGWRNYSYKEEIKQGMKYGIWYGDYFHGGSISTGYCLAVVNLTKDSLEIELLRRQLSKKNNEIK